MVAFPKFPHDLMTAVKKAASSEINCQLANRIKPIPPSPFNYNQTESVATTIGDHINYEAALDLF
jgi:hypothetical protein